MDTELNKYIKLLENSPNDSKLNSWIGNYLSLIHIIMKKKSMMLRGLLKTQKIN